MMDTFFKKKNEANIAANILPFTNKPLQEANCKIPVARWGLKTSWILSHLQIGSADIS